MSPHEIAIIDTMWSKIQGYVLLAGGRNLKLKIPQFAYKYFTLVASSFLCSHLDLCLSLCLSALRFYTLLYLNQVFEFSQSVKMIFCLYCTDSKTEAHRGKVLLSINV